MKLLNRVRLLATPWTAAYQAPPSMGLRVLEWGAIAFSIDCMQLSISHDLERYEGKLKQKSVKIYSSIRKSKMIKILECYTRDFIII